MDDSTLYPNDEGVTPMELIPKHTNVAMIVQSGGVWFANGKFGTTWKLVQAKVKPRASLKGRCHIALSADEREKLDAQKENSDDQEPTLVVDSDDEDSAAADVAPTDSATEAEQAPPKKKRVIKKKVTSD
jgi:hypothetical protein